MAGALGARPPRLNRGVRLLGCEMTEQHLIRVKRIGWTVAIIGGCFVGSDLIWVTNFLGLADATVGSIDKLTPATLLHLALSLYIVTAGIAFANRRPGARGALEIGCWIWLLYLSCFGIRLAMIILRLGRESVSTPIRSFSMAMAVTAGLVWVVGSIAIIVFLRSIPVREVFCKDATHHQGAA